MIHHQGKCQYHRSIRHLANHRSAWAVQEYRHRLKNRHPGLGVVFLHLAGMAFHRPEELAFRRSAGEAFHRSADLKNSVPCNRN